MWVAYLYEALGEPEEALDWLERACEARSPALLFVGTRWMPFASVREHPRFLAVLDEIGVGRGGGGSGRGG